jgi:L-iditol 2-dehydrogenase
MAIYLLESGKVNLKPIVTHKYPLEESLKAFEKMTEINGGSVKVMITCNKDFD